MKKQCYTIVELLVVIAIMAVIIGIAIPGLNNLINGNKVERAAKQLAAAISKARSEAIVTNRKVALLLPVKYASGNNIKTTYGSRAYAIVVLQNGYDYSDSHKNGYDVTKINDFAWQQLPRGTYLSIVKNWTKSTGNDGRYFDKAGDPANSDNGNIKTENVLPMVWEKDIEVNNSKARYFAAFAKNSDPRKCRMLIFNPDGTVSGDGELSFFLVEGVVHSNGTINTEEILSKKEDKYKERPSAAIGFKLNKFTGRVKYYEELQ